MSSRREEWMGAGASPLLYHLLNALVDDCYPLAHQLGLRLRHIEENMFNNNVQHLLHEIANLRRDIIILRSILKSQLQHHPEPDPRQLGIHPGNPRPLLG